MQNHQNQWVYWRFCCIIKKRDENMKDLKEKYIKRTRNKSRFYLITSIEKKESMDELLAFIIKPKDMYASGSLLYPMEQTVIIFYRFFS